MAPPPPSSDYTSTPSTGKLKLKGVKDAKVDKKKKLHHHSQKKPRLEDEFEGGGNGVTDAKNDHDEDDEKPGLESEFKDNSVVLKSLADEDTALTKEKRQRRRRLGSVDGTEVGPGAPGVDDEDAELGERVKTEAEKRYDEQRRKRLEERLKREGVKTHKQRVEELNRYLSGLSEHHDMPRIGPG